MLAPARLALLPVPEGERLIAGEEDEVDVVEGIGVDALDERDLVADGFEAAELGLVVHEDEVSVREGRIGRASLSSLPRSEPAPTMAIFK